MGRTPSPNIEDTTMTTTTSAKATDDRKALRTFSETLVASVGEAEADRLICRAVDRMDAFFKLLATHDAAAARK
jgi:hypothetical protein